MKYILLLLCVTLCYSSSDWDYLLFVQVWPGSWINDVTKVTYQDIKTTFNNTYFTIHGLWPEYYNSTWPEFCNKDKFNISAIQNITKYLEIYWTNFHNPAILWSHEFQKHASCAKSDPLLSSEYKYFSAGLNLRNQMNLYAILKNSNIVPSNNIKYDVAVLGKAVSLGLNHTAVIICDQNNILNEIRVCLNKNLELFDCPSAEMKEQCQQEYVIYNQV